MGGAPTGFLYLNKIIEPISNNTSKTRCKLDLIYCKSCHYVIRLVYWIINHTYVVD